MYFDDNTDRQYISQQKADKADTEVIDATDEYDYNLDDGDEGEDMVGNDGDGDDRYMGGGGDEPVFPDLDVEDVSNVVDPMNDNDEIETQYISDYAKFDNAVNEDYISRIHPEHVTINYSEIAALAKIIRTADGIIRDPLHLTMPILTKYEKSRILGQRAAQINSGSKPFVDVPNHVIDGYLIAELELRQKKIPFIIQRPLPTGTSEYWYVRDLEQIDF